MVVMDPSGDVASQQAHLIIIATLLMLIVIVPVIFLALWLPWRYRQSNKKAHYDPEWAHSTKLELIIWGVPLLIIIAIGLITWISTHRLDPYAPLERIDADTPLAKDHKPLVIQAVSLDWKWLFIYPEQGVASVNEVVAPVNTPIRFHITSSAMMNSFYIPALAGQIYAMAGMQTSLNAVINKPGVYKGFSANYSGEGFSDMRFKFHGVSDKAFYAWVNKAKTSGKTLDKPAYQTLVKPSSDVPVSYYGHVAKTLYHDILNRCLAEGTMCMDQMTMMGKKPSTNKRDENHGEAAAETHHE